LGRRGDRGQLVRAPLVLPVAEADVRVAPVGVEVEVGKDAIIEVKEGGREREEGARDWIPLAAGIASPTASPPPGKVLLCNLRRVSALKAEWLRQKEAFQKEP